MKKKILICVLFTFCTISLCGCDVPEWIGKEKQQPNEQQLQCEHEWVEIDWHAQMAADGSGVIHDIYCPKCQLETNVSSKQWNRMKADMNYKNSK